MKLTTNKLKRIIREELGRLMETVPEWEETTDLEEIAFELERKIEMLAGSGRGDEVSIQKLEKELEDVRMQIAQKSKIGGGSGPHHEHTRHDWEF